ncbi:trimethylamine--corrinoid protein Co-methyltransferase [Dongia mobilis]|uniref:Methyltransferase n=1 Tax=Dongia mobilis TaxID=578943 RepID=A0A4R6WWY7_9PROT|nr:trimethylamine methyltransferase family protein [Dongia mobilis]TDQ82065.1 trimethylamine--corrinoid protein Co-methyltransferase [Dongia mobilis]
MDEHRGGHPESESGARVARRRRGVESARRPRESGVPQVKFPAILRRALKPIEPLRDDQLEDIHQASLTILEEIGIEFMGSAARALFEQAGARVDHGSGLVRIPRAVIDTALKTAPACFRLTPRNPARAIELGHDAVAFGLVAGPPNVHDCVIGRRAGNLADYQRLVSLAQCFDIIHLLGNQVTAPQELPVATRHLDCYRANVTLTDKVYHCTAIGRERALDGIDMMAISRGLTREQMVDDPGVLTIISVNSPRRFDEAMSDGLMAMAEWGQAVVVTPFTLMGAMAPVSIAAALAQQNAEALAGIALTQLTRPGSPVVYGAFTSNVDLRSGAPAFGTAENARATMAGGQLARRYNLPYRASNASASNIVDAQAAYESQMSLWSSVMGGANLVYHGAGWMEGGLTASFEKIVLDVEMLQMMAGLIQPFDTSPAELGLDAQREVPPGGHFFGAQHTLERYQHAFQQPLLSDWRSYPAWAEDGAKDATQRATAIWQQALAHFTPPPLDPAIAEALDAFVAKRREERKHASD